MKPFLSFLFAFLACGAALADQSGLFFRESLFYDQYTDSDLTTKTTNSNLYTSTSLGYVLGGWAYLGATYNYFKTSSQTTVSGSDSKRDTTYNEYGPSFGYITDNWHIIGTYLLLADKQWTDSSSSGTTQTGRTGTGLMFDLGYQFSVSNDFKIGPSLVYRSVNYVNCKDPNSGATSTCNPAVTYSGFEPYIGFIFNFH